MPRLASELLVCCFKTITCILLDLEHHILTAGSGAGSVAILKYCQTVELFESICYSGVCWLQGASDSALDRLWKEKSAEQ